MRLWLAIRIFFATLFQPRVAERTRRTLEGPAPVTEPQAADQEPAREVSEVSGPARSEAITLLATLQREARFVDLVQEPLEQYSDAQIGAAARDVLRDCRKTLERLFDLQPVVDQSEGAEVEVPEGFQPARYRLIGEVQGGPPLIGQLVHHGWQAQRCELPTWTGSSDASQIVAAAEVEIRGSVSS